MPESYDETTMSAIKLAKDLHQYIGEKSEYDLFLSVRSTAFVIGWLVADLPYGMREETFKAILRDARETESIVRKAGLDRRAEMTDSAQQDRKDKLW